VHFLTCIQKAYINKYGTALFSNIIVVVTHWEMSARAQERRKTEISQQQFIESWLTELDKNLDVSSYHFSISFEFIDCEVYFILLF
jgi:hypothetical protein